MQLVIWEDQIDYMNSGYKTEAFMKIWRITVTGYGFLQSHTRNAV